MLELSWNLLHHEILVRSMGVMTVRTLHIARRLMDLPCLHLNRIVAVEAESRRFRNEEIRFSRAVRIVADTASPRGNGTMNMFLIDIQVVAVLAQLFHGQDQFIAATRQMTRIA